MFWLSYKCFCIMCNAFLLIKSAISSHNSCAALFSISTPDSYAKTNVKAYTKVGRNIWAEPLQCIVKKHPRKSHVFISFKLIVN